ncbi:DUF4403 family protein [Nibrella viscosa]|uniref:DUF4403 family protein n=1 Tax=Nibrella viscosa TaxID=1084524 RepID=A0ABP8KGU1_9BACT
MNRQLLYGTILFVCACQRVNPEPPPAEGFDLPIPTTRSYVAGPVSFRLRELETKINEKLDPVLVGPKTIEEAKKKLFSLRITRSGPVQTQYTNQQVRISAPLQIWLLTPLSRDTTGRPFCSLKVRFQSPLSVSSDWRLASQVKFTDYEWIKPPEINLLGIKISMENFVQKVMENNESRIESAIDAAVYENLRLDKMVAPIWRDIQKPLRINREFGLWLIPNPIGVTAGPIRGNNETISVPLQITFETETELQRESPAPSKRPLPQLQKKADLSQTSELYLMSSIPYQDINEMLQQALNGKDVKVAKGLLSIKEASVYGGQHALIIRTELSGLLNGTVYIQGRPRFDTLTNTLGVTNLDFATGTKSILPRKIGADIQEEVCDLLEKLLKISLGDELAQLPQKIDAAFDRSRASRKADIDLSQFRFVPQKIAVRPDSLQALIKIKSNVAVEVKNL